MAGVRERAFSMRPRSGDVVDTPFLQRLDFEVRLEECVQLVAIEEGVWDALLIPVFGGERRIVDPFASTEPRVALRAEGRK